MVKASGISETLAEIGEQFAWLGAALRTSPSSSGVAFCTPSLHVSTPSATEKYFDIRLSQTPCNAFCDIRFRLHTGEPPTERPRGQCWHGLFNHPVVVDGFPIPHRSEANTGLEIPLNMMAKLTQTWRINIFAEKVVIKGFSTMLIPVKQNHDILIWHLLYNKDGSRISYLASSQSPEGCLSNDDIGAFRHVVGWCSDVQYYAGEVNLRYHPNIWKH